MEAEHVWLACEIKHGVTVIRNEIEKFKLTGTIGDCALQCLSQVSLPEVSDGPTNGNDISVLSIVGYTSKPGQGDGIQLKVDMPVAVTKTFCIHYLVTYTKTNFSYSVLQANESFKIIKCAVNKFKASNLVKVTLLLRIHLSVTMKFSYRSNNNNRL